MDSILKEQICCAIIDGVSDEVIVFDREGRIIKVNNNALDSASTDYGHCDNLNEIYKDLELYDYNGNLITDDKLFFKRVLKGEKISNERYGVKKDKGYYNKVGSGIPIFDKEGNIAAGILIFRDLSKLEYDEIMINKSNYETLSKIIDTLDLCFARFTYPGFDVIEFNNKTYELIKQINNSTGSQLLLNEFSIYNLIPVKKIVDSLSDLFLNEIHEDVCKYHIAGKDVYYKYIYQPMYGRDKNIVEIIVIGIEVTKDVKSRLKMEKALKIQDEIYANVSHELKTPLNVIFSANQMMDMYMNNSFENNKKKLEEYNNIVKQNCYRLSRLINNIVDISRNNSGNLRLNQSNENIVEVVENIVQSVSEYAKSRELRIIFDTDVEEKIILCDAIQIERIMLNLISNAIKFSNPNGEILVNITDRKDKVLISVEDEGVGIEPKHLAHIFQRYYQVDKSLNRNAEGSGIGLAMTKVLVESHGGKIYAKSKVNEGSTFMVELPVKTAEGYYSNKKYKENEKNLVEMIKVEFSDIYNI